jgi:hypothetical protein
VWWENRDADDTDFHNDLDLILSTAFSPRLGISVKDTLRIAEQADQIDRGTAVRERDDYLYNIADAQISYWRPRAPGWRSVGAIPCWTTTAMMPRPSASSTRSWRPA